MLSIFYHNLNMTNIDNMTNMDIITEYASEGPLHQLFMIQAMEMYAEKMIQKREQVIEQFERTIIDGNAWVKCAEDWVK